MDHAGSFSPVVNVPFPDMTDEERKAEFNYRFQERLGLLCEDQEPTPEQLLMAHDEAELTVYGTITKF